MRAGLSAQENTPPLRLHELLWVGRQPAGELWRLILDFADWSPNLSVDEDPQSYPERASELRYWAT